MRRFLSRFFLLLGCLGLLVIFTYNGVRIAYPSHYLGKVYFDWNAKTGFKSIYVFPSDARVNPLERLLGYMIAFEARPFIGHEFRKSGWKEAKGYDEFRLVPFLSLILGPSWESPGEVIDPEVTPLMHAAEKGDDTEVKKLLASGANVNAKDQSYRTALIYASMHAIRSEDVVATLLASGADLEAKDYLGRTALMWAVRTGDLGVVKALLASGADVNAADKTGDTALLATVDSPGIMSQHAIIHELIAAHANVNAKDADGETPLIEAVLTRDAQTVQVLLAAGADVSPRNKYGETALSYAQNPFCPTEVVQLLRRAGARE